MAHLVHDVYVQVGYATPQPSGARMLAEYMNPGTTVILASVDGTDIASFALVPDGPFGLSIERAFGEEVAQMRDAGVAMTEWTSLAIRPEWRRLRRAVFAAVIALTRECIDADADEVRYLLAAEPRQERLYTQGFGFIRVAEVDERPFYREPAVFLTAHKADIVRALDHATPDRLARHRDETERLGWEDRRTDVVRWDAAQLVPLLEEQPLLGALPDQLSLLADRAPELLTHLVRTARS